MYQTHRSLILETFSLSMTSFGVCSINIINISSLLILLLPTVVLGECTCDVDDKHQSRSESLKYKLAAIASILAAGGIGVSLPLLGRKFEALRPENDIFFMIKAFAAGVILATALIHILPEGFDRLTSPCLKENPWGNFPFAGFVAMMSSIGTLMVDSFATSFYKNKQSDKPQQVSKDVERADFRVHTHDHVHGSAVRSEEMAPSDLIRFRVTSQVLELGIVVHSIITGMTLGASESPQVIKTLLAALSFHQFFEGVGLGGCISQAKFKSLSAAIMAICFSFTTPVGIAIGIAISSDYHENTPTALIVEGILDSASAGILIYMSLVDLLAADFMNPRMQSNGRLQLGANISLLLGAACMSVLARWA